MLYTIGYYYIDKHIDIKKGIEILLSMENEKHTVSTHYIKPSDEVYAKIATGYWEFKNKKQARFYVEKALEINPKNEIALKLKASIQ